MRVIFFTSAELCDVINSKVTERKAVGISYWLHSDLQACEMEIVCTHGDVQAAWRELPGGIAAGVLLGQMRNEWMEWNLPVKEPQRTDIFPLQEVPV
jgi:hypothetical protein